MKGHHLPDPRAARQSRIAFHGTWRAVACLATDRASVADFQAFCRETGHALLAWSEENGVFSFVIRRRADDPSGRRTDMPDCFDHPSGLPGP